MIFQRNKRKERARAGEARPKNASIPLSAFYLPAFAVVTLILVLVGFAFAWVLGSEREDAGLEITRIGAEEVAESVGAELEHHLEVLRGLASSPTLAPLLGLDLNQDGQQGKSVVELFPGASRVLVLPEDYDRPDSEFLADLSFASLALLRAAEESDRPPPAEVHQFGSDQVHVAMAARVAHSVEDPAVGLVHVALPLEWMGARMRVASRGGGWMALQQMVPGSEPLTFLEGPGAVPDSGDPEGVVPIRGSIWRVAYWTGPAPAGALSGILAAWLVLGAAWLLIGVAMLLQYQCQRRALNGDLGLFTDLFDRFAARQPVRKSAPKIREVDAVLVLLREKVKDLRAKRNGVMPPARSEEVPAESSAPAPDSNRALPTEIFRHYDIRGVVGDSLTPEIMSLIGRAVGSEVRDRGQNTVIAGRDGRNSSSELADALCEGIRAAGCDLIDLGQVPTPVVYFATHFLGSDSGVMITGSHNPPEYNGVKIVIGGETLSPQGIERLRERIESEDLARGEGIARQQDLIPDYVDRVIDDVHLARPLKVVVDCGNGVAGPVAPRVLRQLGCEVVELYCDVDGNFPNHHPDPGQPQNMQALASEVVGQEAHLGLAFDGDGDRLGVVDSQGKIIWPDRLLMLLAAEVLAARPGADIVYDVKCSRHLADEIRAHSGCPVVTRTGHSFLKAKVRETGAPLAGELSGHIIYQDRWYGFDDAVYAAARLLEILSMDPRSSAQVLGELPESPATPELLLGCSEGEAQVLMKILASEANFPGASVTQVDGMRVEFADGWGLVRASNTTPSLGFRFEADSEQRLQEIQGLFREVLQGIAPNLKLPF